MGLRPPRLTAVRLLTDAARDDPRGDHQPARARPGVLPGGAVRDVPGRACSRRCPGRATRPWPRWRALRTRDPADFTIALLDSWAVALDILTFYSERVANEAFLRTAVEQRSVIELAALVGLHPLAWRVGVGGARVHAGDRSWFPGCRADPGRDPGAERPGAGPVAGGVRDLGRPDRAGRVERAPGPDDAAVVPRGAGSAHVVHRNLEQPQRGRRPAVRGRAGRDSGHGERPGGAPLHHRGLHRPGGERHPGRLGHAGGVGLLGRRERLRVPREGGPVRRERRGGVEHAVIQRSATVRRDNDDAGGQADLRLLG